MSKSILIHAILLCGSNVAAFAPLKSSSRAFYPSALPMSKNKYTATPTIESEVEEEVGEGGGNLPTIPEEKEVLTQDIVVDEVKGEPDVKGLLSPPDFEIDEDLRTELKSIAKELNPIVGFYDPLQLSEAGFWSLGNSGTVGWLRQAEIKHGRVAMAAFVGYCVQSNWHWPWNMSLDGSPFPSIDLSPEAQWDAIPFNAKLQIISVVGFLEFWDELGGNFDESPALGMEERIVMPHYTKGRMPGQYPSFQNFRDTVHWVPDLYDPAGSISKAKGFTEEKKTEGRLAEINNGRLAMIGIMGFLVADKIPGAVPLLKDIAQSYDGNPMIPFASDFTFGLFPDADTLADTVDALIASSAGATAVVENVTEDKSIIDTIISAIVPDSAEPDSTFVKQLL